MRLHRRVRTLARWLAASAMAAAVFGWTASAPDAARTFGNPASIAILDSATPPTMGSPYPSTIAVSQLQGVVKSVAVTISGLSHSFEGDLDIMVSGPGGQALMLVSDIGTAAVSNSTVTFSDAATLVVPNAMPSGFYRPTDAVASDPMPAPAPAASHPAPAGSATLHSVFGGTNPNGDWKLWVVDDANGDSGTIAGGWSLAITTTAEQVVDFDGDAKTDYLVLRAQAPTYFWHILGGQGYTVIPWGPVASGWFWMSDYDGDGRADPVYCASNMQCYIRRSSDGGLMAPQWGTTGDIPLQPGDYDGDGKSDVSVFRPVDSTWYTQQSSNGALLAFKFGQGGDKPSFGDFDGDGVADYVVWRNGTFYVMRSTAGFLALGWGSPGDGVFPGDFDGDGKTDAAVVRQTGGSWTFYVRRSSDAGLLAVQWGLTSDDVVPGDYDGDGKTDIAVWRAGVFYVRKSSDGTLLTQQWGTGSDIPLANFIVR